MAYEKIGAAWVGREGGVVPLSLTRSVSGGARGMQRLHTSITLGTFLLLLLGGLPVITTLYF